MFEYDFMINAFAASGIVAVLAGIVGYFLVLRGQTFAGHALSHVGFTGATGAVLLGISPIWGMVGFTLAAGPTSSVNTSSTPTICVAAATASAHTARNSTDTVRSDTPLASASSGCSDANSSGRAISASAARLTAPMPA
jgi:hypothetical protein